MRVSIIVACGKNGAIGQNGDLLWHLPMDMKYFKETTMGFTVIMGRKSYESIPEKYRPLPGRQNIILSRNKNYKAKDCLVVDSLQKAIEYAKKNNKEACFVIGGAEIYKTALQEQLIDRMYITMVNHVFEEADAFFPKWDTKNWHLIAENIQPSDPKNPYDLNFMIWDKIITC